MGVAGAPKVGVGGAPKAGVGAAAPKKLAPPKVCPPKSPGAPGGVGPPNGFGPVCVVQLFVNVAPPLAPNGFYKEQPDKIDMVGGRLM